MPTSDIDIALYLSLNQYFKAMYRPAKSQQKASKRPADILVPFLRIFLVGAIWVGSTDVVSFKK
jgi:hypothetical protein